MPPKKRPRKDLRVEGSSQTARGQVHETTQTITQLQISTEPHLVATETRGPGEPPEQSETHVEAPIMNTSMPSSQQQPQRQETEAQEDQQ
jgi:hypothetical protein